MDYHEDKRRKVSDSEIVTTAIVPEIYFYGHQRAAYYMKSSGLIPSILDKSRFNRRLHKAATLLNELFSVTADYIQYIRCDINYIIDSFLVALCDNIRIKGNKIIKGKLWRGIRQVSDMSMASKYSSL